MVDILVHTKRTCRSGSAVRVSPVSVGLACSPQPATHFALAPTFGTKGRRAKCELRNIPASLQTPQAAIRPAKFIFKTCEVCMEFIWRTFYLKMCNLFYDKLIHLLLVILNTSKQLINLQKHKDSMNTRCVQ